MIGNHALRYDRRILCLARVCGARVPLSCRRTASDLPNNSSPLEWFFLPGHGRKIGSCQSYPVVPTLGSNLNSKAGHLMK